MAITQVRFYTGLLINKKVIGLNSIDRSASWYYALVILVIGPRRGTDDVFITFVSRIDNSSLQE